jgi:hypothetical protein
MSTTTTPTTTPTLSSSSTTTLSSSSSTTMTTPTTTTLSSSSTTTLSSSSTTSSTTSSSSTTLSTTTSSSTPTVGGDATAPSARYAFTRADVDACALPSWHARFAGITARAVTLPLSDDFVRFLLADGLVLDDDNDNDNDNDHDDEEEDDGDDDGEWSHSGDDGDDESDRPDATANAFVDLRASVSAALEQLGGGVFVKLAWSAPRDWCARELDLSQLSVVLTGVYGCDAVRG